MQHVNLLSIVLSVKDYKHVLIYLKNVKLIYNFFYKDTLFVFYNNNYIRKYSRLIVIIKNVYELSLKSMNNYLQFVSLPR